MIQKIAVMTKLTSGNAEVGATETTLVEFPYYITIGEVYEHMRKKGNWDIIIPRNQESLNG